MLDDGHAAPEAAVRQGLRLLLVEDDNANQEVEMLMLEHLGHDVDVVADGAAAVTAAAADRYDAILMDCHLPVMDGYEATAAIRGGEGPEAHVPIIGLTAHHDRRRCVEAGMDDHLSKPIALADLADALARAMPSAPPSFDGVLDPAIVDQLRMLVEAGSSELLRKLQASFARATPERLRALRAAVASGDREGIAFNVHTLKGSAANLGAIRIVATCRQIEAAVALPGGEHLEPLVGSLEQHAADASAALGRLAETG